MQQDDDDKCEKLGLDEDQELHVPRKDYSGMIIASEIVLSRIRGTLVICRENVVAARSCIRALFKLSTRPEYDEELKRGKVVVSAILPLLEELLLVLRQDGGVVAAVDGEVWMFALAILGNLSMNTTSRSSSTFEESSKDVDEDTRKLILKHVHVLMQAANVQLEQQVKQNGERMSDKDTIKRLKIDPLNLFCFHRRNPATTLLCGRSNRKPGFLHSWFKLLALFET